MRLGIVVPVLAAGLLLLACADGNDDDMGNSSAPFSTDGWETFEAPSGCLSDSYPEGWVAQVRGDIDGEGTESCPGGSEISNIVAECTRGTTGQIIGLTRIHPGGDDELSAWVELHAADARCETVEDEMQAIIDSSDGSLEAADDGVVAGQEAVCGAGQREFEGATMELRVCVAEIEGGIYLLTKTWDSAQPDFEDTVEAIAASLQIDPIEG